MLRSDETGNVMKKSEYIKKNEIKNIKKKLKEWYNKTAIKYDTKGDNSFNLELKSFKKLANIKKNNVILDIATGTGIYLLEAAKRGALCYGIDISQEMLKELKKKVKKLNLSQQIKEIRLGDIEKLDYPANHFDWIFCIGTFEYYPMNFVKKLLVQIKRSLKQDGRVIVDFPNINSKKAQDFKKKEESVGHKIYMYNKGVIKKNLEGLGFEILKIREAGMELQFLLKKAH